MLRTKENIVHLPNTQTVAFKGTEKLSGVEYQDRTSGENKILEVPAVFVAIGQVPENQIFTEFARRTRIFCCKGRYEN